MKSFTVLTLFATLLMAAPVFAAEQSAPSTISPRGTEGPDTRYVPPLPQHDPEWPAHR